MEGSTDPILQNVQNDSFPQPWKNKQGKYVVLVSSDNPWYMNTDTTEPMKVSDYPDNTHNIRQPYYKTIWSSSTRR